MITVRNGGHDTIQVWHSESGWMEYLRPGHERAFAGYGRGHFIVEPSYRRTRDPRFDPQGGDPYNRTGSRAFS